MRTLSFLLFTLIPFLGFSQPVVDGNLSDSQYVSIATKQNSNTGFGTNIDVNEILYYSDVANSKLYLAINGKLDTGTDNAIGLFLNFSGLTGSAAGNNLGFDGAGNYMDGEGGGTNSDFKADFEVDYMFAINPGNGTTSVFLDAAKLVGGNSTDYLGTASQSGATAMDADVFGTGATAMYAFNNGGGANQGLEIVFDYAALGITSAMTIEAFAFVVSSSGFFSDVSVPGNISTGNLGFNPDYSATANGPYFSMAAALPVEISNFEAKLNSATRNVDLLWSTTSEINNDHFSLQRSSNGDSFTELAAVKGVANSAETLSYNYCDRSPQSGINLYRLKQVDINGSFSYSDVVKVNYQEGSVKIAPNPVHGELKINFEATQNNIVIDIFNNIGALVRKEIIVNTDQHVIHMGDIESGIYLVRVSNSQGNLIYQQSIVKL